MRENAALELAAKGVYVAPACWPINGECGCGGGHVGRDVGKAPLTDHGHLDATTDAEIICGWWRRWPLANLQIDLKRTGLVDLAPDCPDALDHFQEQGIPPGAAVFISGGGPGHRHHLLRRPDGCPAHRVCKANEYDLLGNGYAIAPPSLHLSGQRYAWITPLQELGFLPDAPGWAVALLRGAGKDGHHQAEPIPDVIPEGERNVTLTSLAGTMRRRRASEPAILAALEVEIAAKSPTPLDHDEVAGIAQSVARYAPAPDLEFYFPSGFAAKRLAERLLDEHPFAAGGGQLYVYHDGVYRADGDAFVRRRSADILGDRWTRARADEAAAYLLATTPQLWERPPLDTVNVRNGLLDVTSDDLHPHSPDFLSCVQIGAAFDPTAACPTIERFIKEVFPSDVVDLAYELAGHLMIPDTSPQRAVMLVGAGANGKTTYARTLETFLGGAVNVSAITLQALDSNRFAAAGLFGKLANIATDLDAEALKSSAMFKAVASGDPITAERKYGAPFTFAPFARLLFSANEPPPTHDTSFAFFRRWIIIPFDQTFTGKAADPHLLEKLTTPAELSGLLNFALEGLLCLRERGGFTQADSLTIAAEDFRTAVDSAAAFVSEQCLLSLDHRTGQAALYDAYKTWCLAVGRSPLSARRFNQLVRSLLPDPQAMLLIVDGRPHWPGITLRTGGTT